jgi:polysaccharide biosynthesis/export protein
MYSSKMKKGIVVTLLAMGLAVATGAQQNDLLHSSAGTANSAAAKTDDPRPALQHRPRYQVQRSDKITITFPIAKEYDQTVLVRPDGYIALLGVGDIRVEDMTTDQVHDAIQKAYVDAKILHDPILTVDVTDFQKPHYYVVGQVNHPGKFELRDDTTVTGAVSEAGGLTVNLAKHSDIVVFHRINTDWSEAKTVNLKHLLNSKNLTEDIHLQPGDIVYVPQNGISKFKYIVPYSFPLGLYANPVAF